MSLLSTTFPPVVAIHETRVPRAAGFTGFFFIASNKRDANRAQISSTSFSFKFVLSAAAFARFPGSPEKKENWGWVGAQTFSTLRQVGAAYNANLSWWVPLTNSRTPRAEGKVADSVPNRSR